MLLPQAEITSLPDALKWHIEAIPPETSVRGWLAGPVQRVVTHWNGKASKPCRAWMTKSKMLCQCQAEGVMNRRVIGYVPILFKNGDRSVFIVSETVCKVLMTIKPGTLISLTRPKKEKKPIQVGLITENEYGEELSKKMRHACIHDIGHYLLHVWQDKELTEFFGMKYFVPVTPPKPEELKPAA
jgi:hypothetical protein